MDVIKAVELFLTAANQKSRAAHARCRTSPFLAYFDLQLAVGRAHQRERRRRITTLLKTWASYLVIEGDPEDG